MRSRGAGIAMVALLLIGAAGRAEDPPKTPGASAPQANLFKSLSLGSREEPIHINADSLELDYKGSLITYRGGVRVTQGGVTLTSDRLLITYEDRGARAPSGVSKTPTDSKTTTRGPGDAIKEIVAEGNVKIRDGNRLAEGRRAVFDQAKQTIVLSDGAVLHEGPNKVAGDRIVVYLQEERSVVESGSNSRVSAVFYPGASASATPAPGKPPVAPTGAGEAR